jgi:hypothetical protein
MLTHMATRLASTHQGGLVRGARRSTDAHHQHPAGSSPQCHRPEAVHDEGLPSSRWESSGVSHRPGTSVQPDPLPAPGPARGQVWGGSGRRAIAHRRLDAQPANPHFWRLSVCACTSPPLNSGECELLRGKISSSGCCYASNASNSDITV